MQGIHDIQVMQDNPVRHVIKVITDMIVMESMQVIDVMKVMKVIKAMTLKQKCA